MARKRIEYNHKEVNRIAKKLLQKYADEVGLPHIFSQERTVYTLITHRYFLLALVDEAGLASIESKGKRGEHPFPGFIAPLNVDARTGFKLSKNSKFSLFENTKVVNRFSIDLGENSTAVFRNHHVLIEMVDGVSYDYIIDLLYLVSFGDEITITNFYSFLDELVDFSLSYWRLRVE